jgi:predicted esterase
MAKAVIYIPGLGDRRKFGQNQIIKLWRVFGLSPYYFPINWYKEEGFDKKLDRLLAYIEELKKAYESVSLVGISAGAGAAINAFATSNNVDSVILVCGKINNPQTIGEQRFKLNPDFRKSAFDVSRSLEKLNKSDRARILSIHPWSDDVVPIKDTIIKGAREKTFAGWSHVSGIFFILIFGGRTISKFIKETSKS